MPDMFFDVDVAIAGCPVNLLPLIDDTDFKTIEGAVAYNAAGLALYWHFVTSAGAYTVTAVTPTTAGVYDWTDPGAAGIYTIEIPASGGASINNNAEGYGWFTGVATGVLPWRGPVIGFRAAALNDALCDGGDNLDVNTVQWLGTACATPTVAGVPEVDLTHVAGATTNVATLATNVDAILTDTAVIGAPAGASIAADLLAIDNFVDGIEASLAAGVVVAANNDKTGYSLAATGLDAIGQAATGIVEVAKAVWDRLLTGATHNITNSAGKKLRELGTTIAFSGTVNDAAATTTVFNLDAGASSVDNFYTDHTLLFTDGALQGQARTTFTYTGATRTVTLDEALPSAPVNGVGVLIRADHIHSISQIQSGLATAAALAVVDDFLDTEVAAIKAKTDNLPAAPAAVGDIPTAAQNAAAFLTTQMTESYRADGAAPTLAQAQCEIIAHLGESSISGTTKTIKKFDGSTVAETFTLDSATTPTSITRAT